MRSYPTQELTDRECRMRPMFELIDNYERGYYSTCDSVGIDYHVSRLSRRLSSGPNGPSTGEELNIYHSEARALRPPQFSIIINFYNQRGFVKDALESALSQKNAEFEVIVVE
jgi:hypothetical protein